MNQVFPILLSIFIFSTTFLYSQKSAIPFHQHDHILKLNSQGELSCVSDEFKTKSDKKLSSESSLNYTLVRSTNDPRLIRDGLKVILRATDQLMEDSEALLAFRRAAAVWERHIKTDITVVIDVDFGVLRFGEPWGEGVLGSTGSAIYYPLFDNEYFGIDALLDTLSLIHQDNPQLLELYNSVSIPTPSTYGKPLERLAGSFMVLQVLGYFDAHTNPDGYPFAVGDVAQIGFNANHKWDLNPNDGIDSDKYDFDGTVVHEIGHALGFNAISFYNTVEPDEVTFLPWDVFRIRPEVAEIGDYTAFSDAERVVSPGPADSEPWPDEPNFNISPHVYFDGINLWECSTSLGSGNGGDGNQSSHWRDDALRPPSLGDDRFIGIMDPNSGTGDRDIVHYSDLRMLEVIGYKIDYSPPLADIGIQIEDKDYNIDFIGDTLSFGNLDIGTKVEKKIIITNNNQTNNLVYELEIDEKLRIPEDFGIHIELSKLQDLVVPGNTGEIKLSLNTGSSAGIYQGILRFHTNSDQKLVVEIPFEANVGGAYPPTVVLSDKDLGELVANDIAQKNIRKSFVVENFGTLPLNFDLDLEFSERSTIPIEGNIQLDTSPEINNYIYVDIDSGTLYEKGSLEEIILNIESDKLGSGYYEGNIIIHSNDIKRDEIILPFKFSKTCVEPVNFGVLYGSTGRGTGSKGRTIFLDPISGQGEELGISGFEKVSSITINSHSREIYGLVNSAFSQSTKVIKISAANGSAYQLFEITPKVQCLAYDDEDGSFYGIADKDFIKIDISSGEHEIINTLEIKARCMSFNPFSNKLYFIGSENEKLILLNKVSGIIESVLEMDVSEKLEAFTFISPTDIIGSIGREVVMSKLVKISITDGSIEELGDAGYRGIMGIAHAFDPLTDVDNIAKNFLPKVFKLEQNYPNPFNPSTKIGYQLSSPGFVELKVFDLLGREVSVLVNREQKPGNYNLVFNASQLSSGIYIYQLKSGKNINSKKMLLMK